jgi:hypothetical protein
LFPEFRHQNIPVVSLNFNGSVSDRAAGAALFFEFLSQVPDARVIQGDSGNEGDPFAFPPFGLPTDSDHAVIRHRGPRHPFCRIPAGAALNRPAARRAHFAVFRRIDQAGVFFFDHFSPYSLRPPQYHDMHLFSKGFTITKNIWY